MSQVILGIDLGTTFSCVAYVNESGDVVRIPIGMTGFLPSVVQIVDGKVEVGDEAMNMWGIDADHIVRWVKRSMGDPSYLHADSRLFELPEGWADSLTVAYESRDAGNRRVMEIPASLAQAFAAAGINIGENPALYELGEDRSYNLVHETGMGGHCIRRDISTDKWNVHEGWSAVAISAEILKELKRCAENQLGADIVVSEAVITCPAYFNSNEIAATKEAGLRAGIKVKRIVKEPIAAGVYHATGKLAAGQRILVCDIGGGTFDATVLEVCDDGSFEALHTKGNRRLGGHDWTEALKEAMAEEYKSQHGENLTLDPQTDQMLYQAAEKAKKDLATVPQVTVPVQGKTSMGTVVATRDQLDDLTGGLIEQINQCLDGLLKKAQEDEKGKKDGIQSWKDIDVVLLVGGSSRLKAFQQAVEDKVGKKPELAAEPDWAIGFGAAALGAGRFRPQDVGLVAGCVADDGGGLVAGGIVAGGIADGGMYQPGVKEFTPRRVGTRAFDLEQRRIVSAEVIPRGTQLPTTMRNDDFFSPGSDYVDIPVIQFEDEDSDEFDGQKLYRCSLKNVAKDDSLGIEFQYDSSGIGSVTVYHLKTQKPLPVEALPYQEPPVNNGNGKPWTLLFALDVSWSMSGAKLNNAKDALINSASAVLASPGVKVGVVLFGSDAQMLHSPSDDNDAIVRQIRSVECDGSTNMSDALELCRNKLAAEPDSIDKEIVLLTDGMPDSEEETLAEARRVVQAGVKLSALAIGDGVDEAFLRKMTPNVTIALEPRDIGGEIDDLLGLGGNGGDEDG